MAATQIQPVQAESYRTYLESPAGVEWLAARNAAWPEAQTEFAKFRATAIKRGFATDTLEEALPDLVLPPAGQGR